MVNYQEPLSRTFAALGDPTRRAILARLEREDGAIVSELARPLPVYSWLDVVPKGRNETKNGNLMDWVRRHDRYEDDGRTRPAGAATAKPF